MQKRRLKKWVKVLLTILILIISAVIYFKTGYFGELAQDSIFYQVVCLMAWFWLIMGQIMVYVMIWED